MPRVLSDLVLRLLEKMPERRYGSAQSLLADLREADARLDETGAIAPFDLGLVDLDRQLPLPERLFGREAERAALAAAWQRARRGPFQVLVVSGEAGIGKSALVHELGDKVVAQGGRTLTGKADITRRHTPHAPLRDAFRDVAASLDGARGRRIAAALGAGARSLGDLVPGLERVTGEPPPLLAVDPVQRDDRLLLAVRAFLGGLATADEPLLLFIDDLQWADAATLEVLASLVAGGSDLGPVLLVLACRPEETAAVEAARTLVAAVAAGAPTQLVLNVPPLPLEVVQTLFAETFHVDAPATRALAELLVGKTAGNPLFLRRLLRFLQQAGLLSRDPGTGVWGWDPAQIAAVQVTDNVVELLTLTLRTLPDPVQQLLGVAACVGRNIPLALLAAAHGQPEEATARALAPAVAERLVRPGGDGRSFVFVHDRVLQAVYTSLPEDRRRTLHLRLGRALLAETPDGGPDERLFAIVDQLGRAGDRLTDGERIRLAELCLRAGDRARDASAWVPALDHHRRGIEHLGADGWRTHPALAAALHRNALAGAYIVGNLPVAAELFEAAVAHAPSAADRAPFYATRVWAGIARGAADEGVRAGREGLALFEDAVPATTADAAEAGARELAMVEVNLAGRPIDRLVDAPPMQGRAELAQMELLTALNSAAFVVAPPLRPFVVGRMVNLTLRHGPGPGVHAGLRGPCNPPAAAAGRVRARRRPGPPGAGPGREARRPGVALPCPGQLRRPGATVARTAARHPALAAPGPGDRPAGRGHAPRRLGAGDRGGRPVLPGGRAVAHPGRD